MSWEKRNFGKRNEFFGISSFFDQKALKKNICSLCIEVIALMNGLKRLKC